MAKLYEAHCGGASFPICEYKGYKFMQKIFHQGFNVGNIAEYMKAIENTEIREDDVILLTYPKSGTHLLKEVIHMLQVGRIEYMSADIPNFPLEYRDLNEIASLKSPRMIYSHLWYSMLPKQLTKEHRGKIVALIRNPKDTFVSFWHFTNTLEQQQLPLENFVDLFIKGDFYCGGWYDWRDELVKGRKENKAMLTITYEDCVDSLEEQIYKIAAHMEKDVSDEFVDNIVKACEINTMRKEKRKTIPREVSKFFKDGYDLFYRKGLVGDWKSTLPANVNTKFDKWIKSQSDDDIGEIPNYMKFYDD